MTYLTTVRAAVKKGNKIRIFIQIIMPLYLQCTLLIFLKYIFYPPTQPLLRQFFWDFAAKGCVWVCVSVCKSVCMSTSQPMVEEGQTPFPSSGIKRIKKNSLCRWSWNACWALCLWETNSQSQRNICARAHSSTALPEYPTAPYP